jgi:hypothetical protein
MAAGNTYEAIRTETIASAQASVTFSSIPSNYTDLVLVCNLGSTSALQAIIMRANGDTGSNYSYMVVRGNGSTVIREQQSNQTQVRISVAVDTTTGAGDENIITNIMNYSNTNTFKTFLGRANNASTNGSEANVSMWRSTAAIYQLDIGLTGSTFVAGSTFSLYGIARA